MLRMVLANRAVLIRFTKSLTSVNWLAFSRILQQSVMQTPLNKIPGCRHTSSLLHHFGINGTLLLRVTFPSVIGGSNMFMSSAAGIDQFADATSGFVAA